MITLIELGLSELKALRELYRYEWPKYQLGFNTLSNFVRWFEIDTQLKYVKVYTVQEKWRESGLYLIVDRFQLFLNSLKSNDENLGAALKLLDWRRGYKITTLPKDNYQIVMNALNELKVENIKIGLINVYRLWNQQALQFETNCPLEFEVRSLNIDDADTINNAWPSKQAGSLYFLRRLIAYNISVGLYEKVTHELVAWTTRCQCGFLGTLHVKDAYRRRGLATFISKVFSKKVAESGDDVTVTVHEYNNVSNMLFKKLNFEFVGNVFHIFAFCAAKGLEWPNEEHEAI